MQTMRKEVTQELTPKDPPAAPDHSDRTAGGFGGAAPASLDLYGQSRTNAMFDFCPQLLEMYIHTGGRNRDVPLKPAAL